MRYLAFLQKNRAKRLFEEFGFVATNPCTSEESCFCNSPTGQITLVYFLGRHKDTSGRFAASGNLVFILPIKKGFFSTPP